MRYLNLAHDPAFKFSSMSLENGTCVWQS